MKNIIVGTAGHVDHGKTCLIKALTGTDTDRLKEEKKRGITIELGFAQMPNDKDLDIGIIDVPGHEKFVRHMLAGIGGIDIVLLIIAADEGIMPQTREHFEILKMMDIEQGIVVITKMDMVDGEWLDLIREEISGYVKGTFMESSPVIEVSSYTGQNIKELSQLICQMAASCKSRKEDKELLRLPIDRVFTIDGFGTVVTGTLMEGSLETGDEVSLYPNKKKAKVRNVQVHGQATAAAKAGQRTAINLTGIKKEEIRRGNVIAGIDSLETTMMVDVRIDMFEDTDRELKNGSRVHLYYGSAEVLCKVVLMEDEVLAKGQSGYAQLRLEEEIAVRREDRFILRFYSPLETIGGGKILNSHPPKRKRLSEKSIKALEIQDNGSPEDVYEEILREKSGCIPTIKELAIAYGATVMEAKRLAENLAEEGRVKRICEDSYLHMDFLGDAAGTAKEILSEYHSRNPLKAGMIKEEFRMKLRDALRFSQLKDVELICRYFIDEGRVNEAGGFVCLPEFKVEYTEEQKKLAESLMEIYKIAGVQPEDKDSIAEGCRDKGMAAAMLESLVLRGSLTKLTYQYYIDTEALNRALDIMKKKIGNDGRVTLGEFRDLINASRKYAVMILEYADSIGMTVMTGDARALKK